MSPAQNHKACRGHRLAVHPGHQRLKTVPWLPQALSCCPIGSNLASPKSKSRLTTLPNVANHRRDYGQSLFGLTPKPPFTEGVSQEHHPERGSAAQCSKCHGQTTAAVTDIRREGTKDPGSGWSPPWSPFFQNPATCREAEGESTHLDFIPVVFVLLQHSGCVEWSLWHHHRLLEGAPGPWIRPCGHPGQHWLPYPTPFLPVSDGETGTQGGEGA